MLSHKNLCCDRASRVLPSFAPGSGLERLRAPAVTLLSVTTRPGATGTTHWKYIHACSIRCFCTGRTDSPSSASLQRHRTWPINDLPARGRTTIPEPGAPWPARSRLGGVGSSGLAREPHRASSRRLELNCADRRLIASCHQRGAPRKECPCHRQRRIRSCGWCGAPRRAEPGTRVCHSQAACRRPLAPAQTSVPEH